MTSPARQKYDDLNSYAKFEALITNGEAEGLYLECKAPSSPQLSREQRVQLAKALSGFGNTEGGVIVWGISTTRNAHHNLDICTQLEPIGVCRNFAQQIQKAVPTLTVPPVTTSETKVIVQESGHSKGLVVTYIPKLNGDPIQSVEDDIFYFRSGDEFTKAPYEMIRRLFAATESPELEPFVIEKLASKKDDGKWEIHFSLFNKSSAVAEFAVIFIEIQNASVCEQVNILGFSDVSAINPGKKIFQHHFKNVIHRGINETIGPLRVLMRPGRRLLKLKFTVYANKMRAMHYSFSMNLNKKKVSVDKTGATFVY